MVLDEAQEVLVSKDFRPKGYQDIGQRIDKRISKLKAEVDTVLM